MFYILIIIVFMKVKINWSHVLNAIVQAIVAALTAISVSSCAGL